MDSMMAISMISVRSVSTAGMSPWKRSEYAAPMIDHGISVPVESCAANTSTSAMLLHLLAV